MGTVDQLIREAREHFKRGEHDAAIQKFNDAQKLRALKPLDSKFLALARQRRPSGG